MPRRIRRARPSTQPLLPLRPTVPPVPVAPAALAALATPSPPESVATLAESLLAAWKAEDWPQIHKLMDVLKDHEEFHYVRRWSSYAHVLCFAIGCWYWQQQAAYWREQAEGSADAIDTVLHRLFELDTYRMGEKEQQEYRAWLREEGPCPEVIGWDTDPAWFKWPDISWFVTETLEATPYRREQERWEMEAYRQKHAAQASEIEPA
jgi:hypothetical protein